MTAFEQVLQILLDLTRPFATLDQNRKFLIDTSKELACIQTKLSTGIANVVAAIEEKAADWKKNGEAVQRDNLALHAKRNALREIVEQCQDLSKQVELAAKLVERIVNVATAKLGARNSELWPNSKIKKACRSLENERVQSVDALQRFCYFVRQADWLQIRFPDAKLRDVEGLVKLVDRAEIAAHDWSLTPSRYVGVAPAPEDEDFNFVDALHSIHTEWTALNEEATELAAKITQNFEELGV